MKSDSARGEFGAWLRRERTARFENVPAAVKALLRDAGHGIAPSVWAELESGTRRPSDDHREWLTAYFGGEGPINGPESSDLVQALREQTAAISALATAIREDRDRISPEGLKAFLAQLRSEGLLLVPGIPASTGEPQQQSAVLGE